MKQIKRVFTCLLCFSLLLSCSLFSVGVSAESVSDYIIEYKVYDHSILPSGGYKGQVLGQDIVSHGENSIKSTTNALGNFVINNNTQYMIQLAVFKSDYSTMFRKDDTATITLDYLVSYFTLGTTRNDLKKLDILNYRFLYTDGTYSSWNDLSSAFNYVADSNTHNYSLKFTAEKDIRSVIFREWYKPKNQWGYNGTYQNDVTLGFGSFNWSITSVTESKESELLGDINNSIQEGTDQITNGWQPNPETPDNADDVGELGSIEEQLQSGSEEGINAGMDMITGLGNSLTGFQKGFVFLIDLFDELTGEIKWISSVLTIGLALGIVAFLLNIVGSVASKISRNERRAEADTRREKRQHKG